MLKRCRFGFWQAHTAALAFWGSLADSVTATTVTSRAKLYSDLAFAVAGVVCGFGVRSDALPHLPSRLNALPRTTLWAWERREDLRGLDTRRFAVAYLDRTLTIGATVYSQPRRDALVFPAATAQIAVVRIEAPRNALLTPENRELAVRGLLRTAEEPGIAALQVDFDATRSQRGFYRALLVDLRRRMPAHLPLSITALASWCSADDWLSGLPVDEAVPMFFRMEPGRSPGNPARFAVREPLCTGSAGVSTTEPWPDNLEGKRIYAFADHGWRQDTPAELERRIP